MKARQAKCATCPFIDGSPTEFLRADLTVSSLKVARICHSTGKNNAFHEDTGKPEEICRGSRDFQLGFFCAIGLLKEPTDEAWVDKCKEMGIEPDTQKETTDE